MAIGSTELVILVALFVFLFGAKKLPELARNAGRAKGEFQQGMRDVSSVSKTELDLDNGGITKEVSEEYSEE
ncbi:MAG: twin-arginine translocase TatA/TatE family subunit [Euryarchaeota archaeon]|jgi:TatA/E family protein of Tat protein translocase|nr:twin-arginine translocase TatA/TatE family subunit [Euryarchaeota archaeon]MBT4391063.1 twin-arginine translocase TatA/TatE family subunit [Euryarchaeota archaeon]MBT4802581.1 twin-arginine translocase TatA/TatE family subunit [Euryarchaeota archaeon]MBT5613503.1 twin-arginine translocase TatA/TatE family subunit [Euryarchaeota archaeon]MBT6683381.1 twin-arginine translocase TatA/TatE family subunit [Euryarchaeota archaeon]